MAPRSVGTGAGGRAAITDEVQLHNCEMMAGNSDRWQVSAPQMLVRETAVSGCDSVGFEIALSKMIRNLVEGALFPPFGFGEPENSAFGIQ